MKRSQLKIKVLIADDSPLMRRAIRELLSQEAGIEIVGEAYTLSDTLAMKEQYQPDIVVMDLHMMEESEVPPALLSASGSKVLAISICDPRDGVPKAENLGASAFIDKLVLYETLVPKIFELHNAHS
jgi:DNA-binding NarL/FixJ family response regulator